MYSFPSIARLAEASEEELRALGLGYRAPWIRGAAITLHQMATDSSSSHASGLDFLLSLRTLGEEAVQDALMRFKGVGMKVADCIALFSLDQPGSIPVDTHVWQIACRDLDPSLKHAKCVIIPLGDPHVLRNPLIMLYLREHVPDWSTFVLAESHVYLGVIMEHTWESSLMA